MAHEKPVHQISLIATPDLSAAQFRAVKINATGQMELAGAGENAIGVLQEKVPAGQVGNVMVLGETKMVFGGVVAAGANIATDALGRAVTAGGGDAVIGVAREASGAAGEIHTVSLVTRTSSGVQTNSVLSIPVSLANVVTGDVVTDFIPGYVGTILSISAVITTPTTDVDADATISLEIGAVPVTGGVVTLDDVNAAVFGATIAGTAIAATNVFTAADPISVVATVTNAFTDGELVILITLG